MVILVKHKAMGPETAKSKAAATAIRGILGYPDPTK